MSEHDDRRRGQQRPQAPVRASEPGTPNEEVLAEVRELRQRHREGAPWSEDEVLREMQRVEDLLDDDVALLKALGIQKARSQNQLELARAKALLVCKRDHKDMSSDKLREAWIINQPVDGVDIGALMLQADLDNVIYWDQHATVKARMAQLDTLRSMVASARNRADQWGGDERRRGQGGRR